MPKYNDMKQDQGDLKVISLDDFKRMVNRFPEGSSFYIPLQIVFHTGMRAAEVCGLAWDCVSFEKKSITVEKIIIKKEREWVFGTPKTTFSNREMLIGDTLLNILRKQRKNQKLKQDSVGAR